MSSDKGLKQVYWDNLDLYSKVYCDVEGIPYKDLKQAKMKKERDQVKPVILGVVYGSRGPQVANLMSLKIIKRFKNKETGAYESKEVLDVEAGWEWREKYLNAYPDLKKFMDKQELECV